MNNNSEEVKKWKLIAGFWVAFLGMTLFIAGGIGGFYLNLGPQLEERLEENIKERILDDYTAKWKNILESTRKLKSNNSSLAIQSIKDEINSTEEFLDDLGESIFLTIIRDNFLVSKDMILLYLDNLSNGGGGCCADLTRVKTFVANALDNLVKYSPDVPTKIVGRKSKKVEIDLNAIPKWNQDNNKIIDATKQVLGTP